MDDNRLIVWVALILCFTMCFVVGSCSVKEYAQMKLMADNGYEQVMLPGSGESKWQKVK